MTHKISATLPALGAYTISFHKESAKLLKYFTDKELNRLSKVAHLALQLQFLLVSVIHD